MNSNDNNHHNGHKPGPAARPHFPDLTPETMDIYFGRNRELEIVRELLPSFNGTMLDVGCGRMPYREMLTQSPSRVGKYIGMDIWNEAYQQEIKPDIYWDGKKIPLADGSIDRAFATSVFEHIAEPLPAMMEVRRVLKSDGVLFLTVPFLWPLHDAPHDFHRFTPFALDHMLRRAGFGDVLMKPMGGWNAAMAQMLGLWITRSPLPPEQKRLYGEKFFEFYQILLESDKLPDKYTSRLIFPGLAALAFAGKAPAAEMFGFHKRGLVGIAQQEPLPVPDRMKVTANVPVSRDLSRLVIHVFPGRNHHHVPELITSFWKFAEQMGTRQEDHVFYINDDPKEMAPEALARYKSLAIPGTNLRFVSGPLAPSLRKLGHEYPESSFIFHSGFFTGLWKVLSEMPQLAARSGWVIWGGDLMEMKRIAAVDEKKEREAHEAQAKAIPSLRWIFSCSNCKGDFELVEEIFGPCGNYSPAFYSDSSVDIEALCSAPIEPQSDPVRILLGNSGAESNHHLEALEWLSRYKDEAIEIICPLSYGSKNGYAEEVATKGSEMFGTKFVLLMEVIERSAYNALLDSIDVLVFNHRRQQGAGNLYYMILSGKVSYIRQDTSLGRMLNGFGIKLRESSEIEELTFDQFRAADDSSTIENNRRLFRENLAAKASQREWRKLFKSLSKSETGLLITVGIITYNRASLIGDAIKSALGQEFEDFEILIADDGSDDNTEGFVKSFDDPRVRYLKLEHQGAPKTRNAAIEAARGDFILWLDSDDLLTPDALKRYSEAIEKHPEVDVHYGDWLLVDGDLNEQGAQLFDNWYKAKDQLIPRLLWKSSIPHGGTLIRRSMLQQINGYDPEFPSGHDDQMWSRAAQVVEFRHVGGFVYSRREHKGSLTKARVDRQLNNRVRIIRQMATRYTLRELVPTAPWGKKPDNEAAAIARYTIGDGLLQRNDFDGAIEQFHLAHLSFPNPKFPEMASKATRLKAMVEKAGGIEAMYEASAKQLKAIPEPSITIGIITYNRAEWLPDAIKSALTQDYSNFEIVVVDDGSTDNTEEVVASLGDSRIRYIRQDHLGAPFARNRVIAESKGEFILWLDSDDFLLPRALKIYLDAYRALPQADVYYGDWLNVDENLVMQGVQRFHDWIGQREAMIGRLVWDTVVPNGGTLIRKSLFDRIGGYDETFTSCHDDQFWSRAAGQAHFKHAGAPVYKRRVHSDSMTRGKSEKQNIFHPRIVKGLLKLYPLRMLTPEVPWGRVPENEAAAMAHLRIAERLIQRLDWAGALEQIEESLRLHPEPKTTAFKAQIETMVSRDLSRLSPPPNPAVNGGGKNQITVSPLSPPPFTGGVREGIPLISIVIPSYNRAKYLGETISSALSQDYPNFEVLVVDDGSNDGSDAIMNGIKDSRFRWISSPHVGAPAARNIGIKEARGEFICWLDSDDVLLSSVLKDYAALLAAHPQTDIAYGSLMVTDSNLKIRSRIDYIDWAGKNDQLPSRLLLENPLPHPGTIIRRSLYERFGGYDTAFRRAHDYEWFSRAACQVDLRYLGRPVAKWRWHDSNMSTGSVKVDTSFEARVVKGLLARHNLRELVLGLNWDGNQLEAESAACLAVADRLLTLGDVEGGKEHLARSQKLMPQGQVEALLRQLGGKSVSRDSSRLNGHTKRTEASAESEILNLKSEILNLNILYLVHNFPSRCLAGTELYTLNLAKYMQRQGAKVSILYPLHDPKRSAGSVTTESNDGIEVVCINVAPIKTLEQAYSDPNVSAILNDWLSSRQFDIIHFQHLLGLTASAVDAVHGRGAKLLMTLHDAYLACEQVHMQFEGKIYCQRGPESVANCAACFGSRHPNLPASLVSKSGDYIDSRRIAHQNLLGKLDRLLVPTRFLIDQLAKTGLRHSKIVHWPLGMDLFETLPRRKREGRLRFLYLGNITGIKGIDLLIEAFGKVDPARARLDIHGGIYEPAVMEGQLSRLPDECDVRYRGAYQPADLPRLLASADALVMPSRFEQFPTVAREALHAGVPVIAPNVGGVPEIVEDGINGLLFEAGSTDDLAKKLILLTEKPEILEMLTEGIKPVRSLEEDGREMWELYGELLENPLKHREHREITEVTETLN